MTGSSQVGFCGSGIHFSESYLTGLVERVYRLPWQRVIPDSGVHLPDHARLEALRVELLQWQQMADAGNTFPASIVSRREESLALSVFDALWRGEPLEREKDTKASHAMSRALEMIHGSELETILASELCVYAGCSQKTLEKIFVKQFGVTPKKYIKCLRLARVRQSLRNPESLAGASIIELAGAHGFWHMGQFAADYRAIYGELPSATLKLS
jgi:AraC-like DNA-binding protein